MTEDNGHKLVDDYYKSLIECIERTDKQRLMDAIRVIKDSVNRGRWIFTCGNGGSASTASHYVTDWAKMRFVNKGQKFKALCLSDNIGMLTAYGNDLSYDEIFDNTLENYSEPGDVLVLVSGSGNSANVLKAAAKAHEVGVTTICVVGFDGGKLAKMCDYVVHYPINDMQICEDLHLSFGHLVMKEVC